MADLKTIVSTLEAKANKTPKEQKVLDAVLALDERDEELTAAIAKAPVSAEVQTAINNVEVAWETVYQAQAVA